MKENKDIRNEIVKHFEIHLNPKGFRKKGNSLIRETETGLIQVIDFVLGKNYSITHNHLGLGFGVYTDEWFKHLNFGSKPKTINERHCELRWDFNEFIPKDNNSGWIDLKQNLALILNQSHSLIDTHFISQLDNLTTRAKIIEQWKQKGNAIGLPSRGRLSIAILYWYLKKKELANELIDSELFENTGKPYYNYVIEKRDDLNKNAP
jgi:hypothetical protein